MQIKKTRRRAGKIRRRPPHVAMVASLGEARAALTIAREEGSAAVLVSPPGAAAYLGVGFFAALIDAARVEFPDVAIEGAMDCGADPGHALAALRLGFKTVVLRGHPRAHARVTAIAGAMGARVLRVPPLRATARGGG
jgi:hypothetical protein